MRRGREFTRARVKGGLFESKISALTYRLLEILVVLFLVSSPQEFAQDLRAAIAVSSTARPSELNQSSGQPYIKHSPRLTLQHGKEGRQQEQSNLTGAEHGSKHGCQHTRCASRAFDFGAGSQLWIVVLECRSDQQCVYSSRPSLCLC